MFLSRQTIGEQGMLDGNEFDPEIELRESRYPLVSMSPCPCILSLYELAMPPYQGLGAKLL